MVKNIFSLLFIDLCSNFSREREDRQAIKKEDFILDKLKDQTIYRLPGSVNGQQFIGKLIKLILISLICSFIFFLVQNCDVNNCSSSI